MKSNYDKFPAIKVPADGDCRAVAGWEAIGAEKLHATIKAYGNLRGLSPESEVR